MADEEGSCKCEQHRGGLVPIPLFACCSRKPALIRVVALVALFQLKNVAGTGTSKGLVRLSGMSTEFYHRTESPAEDAFYIAYDYLDRAGAVSEELPVYVFLAREITRLIDRGVKNKIKLANLAIGAFYDRFEIDEQPG